MGTGYSGGLGVGGVQQLPMSTECSTQLIMTIIFLELLPAFVTPTEPAAVDDGLPPSKKQKSSQSSRIFNHRSADQY